MGCERCRTRKKKINARKKRKKIPGKEKDGKVKYGGGGGSGGGGGEMKERRKEPRLGDISVVALRSLRAQGGS